MYVLDMWNRVLIEAGQYILDPHAVELDVDRFLVPVKSVLGKLNKYMPPYENFNVNLESERYFEFQDINPAGVPDGIPDWIAKAKVIRFFGTAPYYLREEFKAKSHTSDLDKTSFPIEYRKPKLWVPIGGVYDVLAVYKHKLTYEEVGGKKKYKVDTINDTDGDFENFFDLLTAKFMITLGRNRRAFTIDDLPITTDADTMISDGEEKLAEALESLIENDSNWFLSLGG